MESFLQIRNLKTHFPIERGLIIRRETGRVRAVDGIDLDLREGEVLGLVGESGCGKSTLGRSILQLIRPTAGTVVLSGRNLTGLDKRALRSARSDFQMVFQDPFASLNPRMTVSDTLEEAVTTHKPLRGEALRKRVAELMERVGLSTRFLKKYPHEFSGGQRQRIAIARALAVEPKLIVADEPVSALDVSIQAQIINLLSELRREMGLTLIFISHDLSVVRHISDRIAVMYLGRLVELGPAEDVVDRPVHPYTRALVSAIPVPDPAIERSRESIILAGDPPSPIDPPSGCRFHPRCPFVIEACSHSEPALETVKKEHTSACIRNGQI